MRWRLAWLGAVLSGCVLGAQPAIPVTAMWDLDPSHDAPGLTWELERDGVIHPCGSVTVTASDRRCAAMVPALAGIYRLRGVTATGAPGEWSVEGSGTQTAPGQFVITWHSPITLTEPEVPVAAAHDGEANFSGRHASAGTWTFSGKTTAGSDRLGVLRFMVATATAISSVTWNGAAMTQIGTVVRGSSTIYVYRILAPPTSASDVVITFSGATPSGPYLVTSYNGVDQTTPVSGFVTNTGSGTTPTVDVSSAADNLVLDAMDVANVISSVGADQTAEFIDTAGGSDRFGGSREAGASTVTMSWTVSSGAWSILAFSLNNASGGGGADAEGALNAPAPTLAASITVGRSVSAAMTIPASVLEAALGLTRSASGALSIAPATLAAAASIERSASGAIIVPASVLAANATTAKQASGALDVPALTLTADGDMARTVAGTLIVPLPVLDAEAMTRIEVSGALVIPASTLTAAVAVARFANGSLALAVPILAASAATEALTVSAALTVPLPVLDGEALVARTASGGLSLPVLVLDGDTYRTVSAEGVLLLQAPTLAATAAIARLVSGDLDAPALLAQANAVLGILQPLMLTRADVVSRVPVRSAVSRVPRRDVVAL